MLSRRDTQKVKWHIPEARAMSSAGKQLSRIRTLLPVSVLYEKKFIEFSIQASTKELHPAVCLFPNFVQREQTESKKLPRPCAMPFVYFRTVCRESLQGSASKHVTRPCAVFSVMFRFVWRRGFRRVLQASTYQDHVTCCLF